MFPLCYYTITTKVSTVVNVKVICLCGTKYATMDQVKAVEDSL